MGSPLSLPIFHRALRMLGRKQSISLGVTSCARRAIGRMNFRLRIYQHSRRSVSHSSLRPRRWDINPFFFESFEVRGHTLLNDAFVDMRDTDRNTRQTKSTLKSFPRERCLLSLSLSSSVPVSHFLLHFPSNLNRKLSRREHSSRRF